MKCEAGRQAGKEVRWILWDFPNGEEGGKEISLLHFEFQTPYFVTKVIEDHLLIHSHFTKIEEYIPPGSASLMPLAQFS